MKPQIVLILQFFLFFLLQSCAKPNYQDPIANITVTKPQTSPETEKPQEINCELYLSKRQICLHLQWLEKPSSQNNSSFLLTFTQGKTSQVLSSENFENLVLNLKVLLWMPGMGHGSVPVIIKRNADSQTLTIERVYFIMPGNWEIRFQIKENENISDETFIKLFI